MPLQPYQLRYPQPGGVHQFQHGPIPQAQFGLRIRGGQQIVHLGLGQRVGQTAAQPRAVDQRSGIVLAPPRSHQPAIEPPQTGQQPGSAPGTGAGPLPTAQAIEKIGALRPGQRDAVIQRQRHLAQVRAIGREGAVGQPVLGPELIEEGVDQLLVLGGERIGVGHG